LEHEGRGLRSRRETEQAECTASGQCENEELTCLTQFKGGYCGASGCLKNADCPDNSICVTQAGANYCFRTCADKAECNENRSAENESNCSSNITRAEEGTEKACVPPSAG
jgi:hypothetical protein